MPILLELILFLIFLNTRIWLLADAGIFTHIGTGLLGIFVITSWHLRGDFNLLNNNSLGIGEIKEVAIRVPLHLYSDQFKYEIRKKFFFPDFQKDLLVFLLIFGVFWRIIALVAELKNPEFLFQENLFSNFSIQLLLYYPWALLQQLLLNGYLVNRIEKISPSPLLTSLLAGIIFGLVHLPNPVLVPITAIGGFISACLFQKNRNIYLLAFGHALLGTTVKYFLPMEWHHNMKVGPGYYTHQIQNR